LAQIVLVVHTLGRLFLDLLQYIVLCCRSEQSLAAENLVLRKQLALYQERQIRPGRIDSATRITLVMLSKRCDWRSALVIVQPATLIRWHRMGFRLFWRWKSRPGRPKIPLELRSLIRRMAVDNPRWGEERIANELLLKLGIQISPRTVRKYMPKRPDGKPRGDQRWSTFIRNHAKAIVACDFCIAITVTFRILYIFVVMEHGAKRLIHVNVTAHPTAAWTLQQLRHAIPSDSDYRFLIHDRDAIFSAELDRSIRNLGLRVLKTPYRAPQANAVCERVIGTMRRECLDWLIPLSETHLRRILKDWAAHYNQARPHMSLGPGVPDPPNGIPARLQIDRHRADATLNVFARSVLGGLHHEYSLAASAA
jgi:transposase InsO family protein